jgi:hypothetical protein
MTCDIACNDAAVARPAPRLVGGGRVEFSPPLHLSFSIGMCAHSPGATCEWADERGAQGICGSAARVEDGGE